MYHVWLLVGNTVVVYMSGVLNSKLKYQHDLFIFIFLVYVIKVSTGGSKLCKYMLLRLLNIKMFLFRIFFINIATGTGWRLYENKKKTTSFYAVVKIKYNSTHAESCLDVSDVIHYTLSKPCSKCSSTVWFHKNYNHFIFPFSKFEFL